MASEVDADGIPLDSVSSYPVNTPVYAVAELHNAPDDTKVTFKWFAEGEQVDEVSVTNTMTDQYLMSNVDGIPQRRAITAWKFTSMSGRNRTPF